MTPSKRLKAIRARTGMTQEELGERLGITANWVSQIETERQKTLGELTEINLRTLEQSPIYEGPDWEEKEKRARVAYPTETISAPRLRDEPERARGRLMHPPPPRPQSQIIADISRLLQGFENLSSAHQEAVSITIERLAEELRTSAGRSLKTDRSVSPAFHGS